MSSQGQASSQTRMTPLWVISIFVSLSEVVTGIAVTQATGGVQVALTAFVIAFPIAVAAAFFGILYSRPYVFYPPSEFGGATQVEQYVKAMQRVQLDEQRVLQLITQAVTSTLGAGETRAQLQRIASAPSADPQRAIGELVDGLARTAASKIEASTMTFDLHPLLGQERQLVVPFDPDEPTSQLLDRLWTAVSTRVKPFTFGKDWAIRDVETGMVSKQMGRTWARANGYKEDTRTIREVGFKPGKRFALIPLT
jgi:hypothetical protein